MHTIRLTRQKKELEYKLSPEIKKLDEERHSLFLRLYQIGKDRKTLENSLKETSLEYLQIYTGLLESRRESFEKTQKRKGDRILKNSMKQFIKELSEIKGEPSVSETDSCLICTEYCKTISFGCGHKSVCPECAFKILSERKPKCPMCREDIKQAFRVFE